MTNQKHLFSIEEGLHYLNGAAYSPTLKSSVERGIEGINLKAVHTHQISGKDHFILPEKVQKLFSKLVNIPDYQRVAIIPSVAYGMATVANNFHRLPNISEKKHIIQIQDEFPNNVYAFDRVCQNHHLTYKTIVKPDVFENRGKLWNQHILEGITTETAMVVMPHIHWIYGVKFDLENISKRCKEVGALLIIDGTQSVGALDFDIEKIQPDALICAGYKWLLGPYSIGLAYFSDFFDDGIPIEESWMHRVESDNFAKLIRYERAYRPKAQRYNMGEHSQFIQMPMLEDALTQLLSWGVNNIQNYTKSIIENPIKELQELGCWLEDEAYRANHLLGVSLPISIDNQSFTDKLMQNKIVISNRGVAIRVSQNIYNVEDDLWALVEVLKGSF
ncbi:Kynureninase [Emticicia aquatica]|uniref:Kynureninase n=1 Tax=Emticicia aquatica TaxID=1681835 RepID=A0ABM9ALN8_9BACT|nr:aminotransferase class V-fold PLP-dependent enzyme [Emticicia aquatica]CAH0994684.1 Kynureninase [Emticicia aquatica]